MCGRYTLTAPVDRLVAELGLDEVRAELSQNFNVAPTQSVAAVVAGGGKRRLELLRWGLVPSWADDPEIGSRMINARSETAPEKPSFRSAFRRRRCLIPADGFYEWQKTGNGKQPFYIRMRDGSPFAFAGLWETWHEEDENIRSCAIITTAPNELAAEIHNRMPVILDPEDYDLWLDPDFDEKDPLASLLKPYPAEAMEAYPVSRFVNSPRHDDERCVEPVAA